MKRIFPVFLFFAFAITTNAQTLTDVQTTLITKRTADWCPFCGTYGWTFTNKLKEKAVGTDAILWNVHYSGGLATPTTIALAKNFGGSGQPLFFLNTDIDDIGVTSSNVAAKVDETISLVEAISSLGSLISMGSEALLSGKDVSVSTKVKFKDAAESGEYYVGTYLIKNNLVWTQASVGPNAVHNNILDQSLTPDFFGTKVAVAPIAKDAEFVAKASLQNLVLHNGKLADTKIIAVIWNKTNTGKYVFINAREIPIKLDNTSAVSNEHNAAFDIVASSAYGTINVEITGETVKPIISLYDLSGKEVIFNISKSGPSTFTLDNVRATSGNYFVKVLDNKQVKTKQIFFAN